MVYLGYLYTFKNRMEEITVSKIPNSLKLMIGIGLLIIFYSLYFLKDHQYYLWIRWTGNILFIAGIILIPFMEKPNKRNTKTM